MKFIHSGGLLLFLIRFKKVSLNQMSANEPGKGMNLRRLALLFYADSVSCHYEQLHLATT